MSSATKIMVVDDEVELANLFREFLNGSGFDTVSFTDPLLAIEHYIQNLNKFSAVITDLRMPRLDGIKLAKRIREIDNKVKILLVTAFCIEDLQHTEEFKQARFTDILQKPLKLSMLAKQINKVLLLR